MSDIRRFFQPGAGGQPTTAQAPAKPAAAASGQVSASPTAQRPAKKSKFFDDDNSDELENAVKPSQRFSASPAKPAAAKAKAATPSKAQATTPSKAKRTKARAATPAKGKSSNTPAKGRSSAAAAASKNRRSQLDSDEDEDVMVIDSDNDSDVVVIDDDDSEDEDFSADSESDSDFVVDSDDEDAPKKKPEAAKATAAKGKAKVAAPASTRGGKKRGRDEEEEEEDVKPKQASKRSAAPASQQLASQPAAGGSQPAAKPGGRVMPASMAATPKPSEPAPMPASQGPPSTGGATGRGKAGGSGRSAAKAGKPVLSPEATAAVAATDAAVGQLPEESEVKFSFLPEGAAGGSNDAQEPPNYGQKDQPEGHPECLTGKTFVISGVLDSLYREGAAELIRRHSGRVTTGVSGKTTFLILGHNAGRTKYHEAKRHNVKLIDEDGLFSLIRASEHLLKKAEPAPAAARAAAVSAPAQVGRAAMDVDEPKAGPSSMSMQPLRAGGLGLQPSTMFGTGSLPATAAAGTSGVKPAGKAAGAVHRAGSGVVETQLWVDKYKPRSSTELVGNPGHIKTLATWLRAWEAVHLRGEAPPATSGGGAKPKDLTKKAVLLSGPPGIGKTSAAHIVSREAGYKVVEMNASDTRNKSDAKVSAGMNGKMSNVVREMVANTSLMFENGQPVKQVLVMDEVDGMSGGDRGGVADLIVTIKKSKIPIICVCNDKYNQKLKSLRNYCLEMDFHKPTDDMMARRLAQIAAAEGLTVNDATLREMARGSGGDMRLLLGQLQMVRVRKTALTFDDIKGKLGTSKDADMSPFESARKLLDPAASRLKTMDRLELYFADSDLVPLLVQENYVNHRPHVTQNDRERMRAIAKAADSISAGDVLNSHLRRFNNWSLMPAVGIVGTLMPCSYMAGARETFQLFPGEMNFPRFSAWFGNYSTSTKQRRLLAELTTNMAASGHVPLQKSLVRLEYCSALRTLLTKPIVAREEEGVTEVADLMQEYCIQRDQLDYVLDVTKFKTKAPWGADPWSDIPSSLKAAFTRRVNKEMVAKSGAMLGDVVVGRGRGKKAAKKAGAAEDEDLEEGAEANGEGAPVKEEEEEEEEDLEEVKQRLSKEGAQFLERASGGGRGRGRGRGSRGGASSGKASGRGRGSGAGSGRGRGKK